MKGEKWQWRTSSYSHDRGECVEVADAPGTSAVRDTQHRHLGALQFSSAEWHAFIEAARHGKL